MAVIKKAGIVSLLVFTAPIAFSYFWWAGFNIISFIIYLIGIICLPLIPTIILKLVRQQNFYLQYQVNIF